MTERFARLYVLVLSIAGSIVLALIFFWHLRALFGERVLFKPMFVLSLGVAVPLLGLAKERNIWANEMRILPQWVRVSVRTLSLYALIIFVTTVFVPGHSSPAENPIAVSAFFMALVSGALCIPFALLRPTYFDSTHRNKRIAISLGILFVATLCLMLVNFGHVSRLHNS